MKQYFSLRNIFLIDGIGAAFSALLLLLLIAPFESFFGLPSGVVYNLAILPVVYCAYSLTCHFRKLSSPGYLKTIALANIFYCVISIALVINYFDQVTIFGIVYFLIEKVIVLPLAAWEWKMGNSM